MQGKEYHDLPQGHLKQCQICASTRLESIIDLGHHPPCDSLLKRKQLEEMEKSYPLHFLRCLDCGLAQIDYVVKPEELFFPDYPYRSGVTNTLVENLRKLAQKCVRDFDLNANSLAIDIGSNDGTTLKGFQAEGISVLGVEPTNIADIAIANGIPTVKNFFTQSVAREIVAKHKKASVVTSSNMFAHIPNLGDLIRGISELLIDNGIFITESHYLLDLIHTVQYDSLYHEHLKYYSLKPLTKLMECYDFSIIDVERISNYGGSIRVYARKGKGHAATERVGELIAEEERAGLYHGDIYGDFRTKAIQSKWELRSMLLDLKQRGMSVPGIGCPGRCSTLLNYCGIDRDLMPYIAEQKNCLKTGLFLPGKHIPIVDEKKLFAQQPEYALMLSWHYSAPIIKKLRQKGLKSKIILPLPNVHISDI